MNPTVDALERDALRHIVLLKHLEAFPDHTRAHRVTSDLGEATLVLLETTASAYDRRAYPGATHAALISSDHQSLTEALLPFVPRGTGVVFKLSSDADRDAVAGHFGLERVTSVLSFTAKSSFAPDAGVRLTREPAPAVFELFAAQHHARDWLEPLLRSDRAFACVLEADDAPPLAVCFAFQNYGRVWEIGGVFTPPAARGRGFASRVVRTALAELEARHLIPRYQVQEDNVPSVRLAEAIGLERFLTITHFLHTPEETP